MRSHFKVFHEPLQLHCPMSSFCNMFSTFLVDHGVEDLRIKATRLSSVRHGLEKVNNWWELICSFRGAKQFRVPGALSLDFFLQSQSQFWNKSTLFCRETTYNWHFLVLFRGTHVFAVPSRTGSPLPHPPAGLVFPAPSPSTFNSTNCEKYPELFLNPLSGMIATCSFFHIVLTPMAANRPSPTHLPPACLRLLGLHTVPEDPKRFSCGVFDLVAYSYDLMTMRVTRSRGRRTVTVRRM